MWAVVVVEIQVSVKRGLHRRDVGEKPASEFHPPVLIEDGPLQALHKAVGPGMSRFRPRVMDTKLGTSLVKGTTKLTSLVREDPLDRPAQPAEGWDDPFLQEPCGGLGGEVQANFRHGVRTGCIASRQLPDLPNALELADVKRVETHQFAWFFGLHMPSRPSLRGEQLAPSAFGQQARRLGAVGFQYG
jgi:hypothetical protein